MISFLGVSFKAGLGVVVVQLRKGVAELLWIPVFMYASLS
jgi:hypothetical protein